MNGIVYGILNVRSNSMSAVTNIPYNELKKIKKVLNDKKK